MISKNKKKGKNRNKIRILPWPVVADGIRRFNWHLATSTPKAKVFEKGNEKIIAVKLGPNRWKAEYFRRGRLMDSSGVSEEEYVKRVVLEMGFYRAW